MSERETKTFLKLEINLLLACLQDYKLHVHRYLSGNTKVISQLKRVSVVNSHLLYPSLLTYMLNKLLYLKEKGKY